MCTITDEVAVSVYRSERDGAPVVEIDTQEGTGVVRVNLNDGKIWDGDPEWDAASFLDGFEVAMDFDARPYLLCLACGWADVKVRTRLREYVADAKAHSCENGDRG